MRAFIALILRDLRLAWTQGGAANLVLGFFVVTITLFPFAIGPDPQLLARIAGGVLWAVALLAALLSLDRLYQADFEDGSIEFLATGPMGHAAIAGAKIVAHWLAVMAPLILVAVPISALLYLPEGSRFVLFLSLLIGSPALSAIGSIAAALTVSVRRGGVLIALLVLPLYIPTLIFAVGAVEAVILVRDPVPHMMLLTATTLVSMVLAPPASAAALRLGLE